ncbi:MAG TPA: glycosyltransferase [Gemmatimonadaceae bacterium]
MRTIKVLTFVGAFGWGGTERQFVNLGLGLDPSRFAVHFGCLRRFGVMLEELEASGVPVIDYDVLSLRSFRAIAAQIRLVRDIRRLGIDVVHTYGFHSHVFAIPAAKLAGASVIASIRDMGVYLSSSQRIVQRWFCRFADQILVNAAAIKEWLVADGYDADRISVIPNGIDLSRFPQHAGRGVLRAELGLIADAPLVAVLGRVSRMKGLEDFLAAAAIVAPRFPKARFCIIGEPSFTTRGRKILVDGTYEAELKRLAASLGLQERVIFTGFRSDVAQILPELSVSVLPSLSEGLSNTLLESMAAGVPVVATRVGGTAEVVQDLENGLLVPPGDPSSLAEAICRYLDAPAFAAQMGSAARRRIFERYSMHTLVENTSRVYESLIDCGDAPLTRPSATLSPLRGARDLTREILLPAKRGEGAAKRRMRGRGVPGEQG